MKIKYYDKDGFYLDKPRTMFTCPHCNKKQKPLKIKWYRKSESDIGLQWQEEVIPNRANIVQCKCKNCLLIWETEPFTESWFKYIKQPSVQEILNTI